MRAIAILAVCRDHSAPLVENTWFSRIYTLPFIDGVEIFFVLSGFLIGSILIKIFNNEEGKLGFKKLWNFWNRRWMRTLPLYFIILFLNYLFVKNQWINGEIDQFNWKFIFFLQNFNESFHGFFWESWSLSVEEWFYLIVPALIFTLQYFLKKKQTFLITTILLILAPLAYRIYNADSFGNMQFYHWDVELRKVVLYRLDTIMYGVLWAFLKFYYSDFFRKFRFIFAAIGLTILIVGLQFDKDPNLFYYRTFYFSLIPLSVSLLLPLLDGWKNMFTFFGKVVTHISLISYAMYLINLGLVYQVISANFPVQTAADGWMKFGLFWIVVIVIATLLYFFIEKPILKLRDRIWR